MSEKRERAKYGAAAFEGLKGKLPNPFPRTMGPNCLKYLQEVVDSGLTSGMIGRFERAFAEALGVKHCIATPGCTPALAILAAAFDFDPGDEIIVSPVTDFGTLQGLVKEDCIPVFPDTEPGTVNMSAKTIEPLITGRTIEDWTAAPACDDVCAGLQGKPWHLNVLGVSLRGVPVTKIVFRDLGTPAAPLLAAVTLENEKRGHH